MPPLSTEELPIIEAKPNGFRRSGLFDRLFGYDFFISYAHRDGRSYPAALAQALVARGYRVFIDTEEYVAGNDLSVETVRSVGKSRSLIVIAGQNVRSSDWVAREIALFVARGRTPIVLENAEDFQVVDGDTIMPSWLRIIEELPHDDMPSEPVLAALERSFSYLRQRAIRKLALASAFVGTVGLIGLSGYTMNASLQERTLKLAQLEANLAVRSERALDDLAYEDSALLALAATAVFTDRPTSDLQGRALAEAAAIFFAIADRVGPVEGEATLHSVAFSGTDDTAAISDGSNGIIIYDLSARRRVMTLPNEAGRITALETSPDGALLMVGDEGGGLTWWSWETLEPGRYERVHGEGSNGFANIDVLAFSRDSKWLASSAQDQGLRLWEVQGGTAIQIVDDIAFSTPDNRPNLVTDMEFSLAKDQLLVATEDNTFSLLEVPSGKVLHRYDSLPPQRYLSGGRSDHVMSVSFHEDGTHFATGSANGLLHHWSTAELSQTRDAVAFTEPRVNMSRLSHLQYLWGGSHIVTAYDTGDILIRDVATGTALIRLSGSHWPVQDMKLSPSGKYIAIAYLGGAIWFYDLEILGQQDLIDQLCHNFELRKIDLSRITSLVTVEQLVELPTELCNLEHRGRELLPILPN